MKGCRVLTDQEIKQVLNELGPRDKTLFLTCLVFGTRISEALQLTFGDVSGSTLYIRSNKGSENQGFPIPESYRKSVHVLRDYYILRGIEVENDVPLFLSQKGRHRSITRQLASTVIKRVVNKLGLEGKINTHSFRKAFVTRIYELTGYNIAETKLYSRHKNLVNLEYYIKTTEKPDLVEQLSWL